MRVTLARFNSAYCIHNPCPSQGVSEKTGSSLPAESKRFHGDGHVWVCQSNGRITLMQQIPLRFISMIISSGGLYQLNVKPNVEI